MKKVQEGFNTKCVRNFMLRDGILENDRNKVIEKSKQVCKFVFNSEKQNNGLIFGRVQSGKTNSIIGSIALFMDNGYSIFVMFTSNDNSLNNQTLSRLLSVKLQAKVIDKKDIKNISNIDNYLNSNEKIIILCPKHVEHLKRLHNILKNSITNSPWIFFDDEADQASLNNNINCYNESLTATNNIISQILNNIRVKSYIQVTATPQAILLQNRGSKFHPSFIVILDTGEGYIGANEIFSDINSHNLVVSDDNYMMDCDNLDVQIYGNYYINIIIDSVISFLIGSSVKFLEGIDTFYTYMAHVGRHQYGHQEFKKYLRTALDIIDMCINENQSYDHYEQYKNYIDSRVEAQYNNILKTSKSLEKYEKVEIQEVIKNFIKDNKEVQILNSNPDSNLNIEYKHYINFIVGGDKLSRGITIKNLLTTYYSRTTVDPKSDTMSQHARMFGYRENLFDVMRVFISQSNANKFRKITAAENELRQLIIDNDSINICIPVGEGLKPTRDQVYDPGKTIGLIGGVSYYPKYPSYYNITDVTRILNMKLKNYIGKAKDAAIEVEFEFIYEILKILKDYNSGFFEYIKNPLSGMKTRYNKAFLIVRLDRDIKRIEKTSEISTILSEEDRSLAIEDYPTLYMYRILGNKEKGWNGEQFWVPIFRFPNELNYILNIS